MKDKRGFELGISTLVVLILAIILLIILVAILTMGTGNFYSTIKGYFSYSNVDKVLSTCNIYATSNQKYNYCCEKNNIKYYNNGSKISSNFTCLEVADLKLGDVTEINCAEINC